MNVPQTKIATFSLLTLVSHIINFCKTPFLNTCSFFLKANAQQVATEIMYGDQTITVAIPQIKRKEQKITWAGLTDKWEVVLSQQTCFGLLFGYVGWVCFFLFFFFSLICLSLKQFFRPMKLEARE